MKNPVFEASKAKYLANFIILAISIYGISQKDFRESENTLFERLVIELVGPIQNTTVSVKDRIKFVFDNYFLVVNASIQNRQLGQKVADLQNQIFQLEELRKENHRLKDLLKFGDEVGHDKILAQVVGWDSSGEFKVLRINKGLKDGIRLKLPVVTAEGLVGHIGRLTDNYSDILTILDQNNRVDTLVDRTRTHGIVEGLSNFTCYMKYVAKKEPLQVGDTVITAGFGHIYPKGIKVGTISRIEKENYGIGQYIEVNPAVNFHKIEEVAVLFPKIKTEQQLEQQEEKVISASPTPVPTPSAPSSRPTPMNTPIKTLNLGSGGVKTP